MDHMFKPISKARLAQEQRAFMQALVQAQVQLELCLEGRVWAKWVSLYRPRPSSAQPGWMRQEPGWAYRGWVFQHRSQTWIETLCMYTRPKLPPGQMDRNLRVTEFVPTCLCSSHTGRLWDRVLVGHLLREESFLIIHRTRNPDCPFYDSVNPWVSEGLPVRHWHFVWARASGMGQREAPPACRGTGKGAFGVFQLQWFEYTHPTPPNKVNRERIN